VVRGGSQGLEASKCQSYLLEGQGRSWETTGWSDSIPTMLVD